MPIRQKRNDISVFALMVLFICVPLSAFISQNAANSHDTPLAIMETYVLSMKVDSLLYSKKCGCQAMQKRDKQCSLYKMRIVSIKHRGDSSIYEHPQELKDVSYIVVPSKVALKAGFEYTITASNSTDKKSLIYVKTLSLKEGGNYYYTYAHAIGLRRCASKNNLFFEW